MSSQVAYYSIVKFLPDTSRGEPRNVAVILAGDSVDVGGVRSAPLSRVAPKAREAGVLDAILRSIAARVGSGQIVGEDALASLSQRSTPSIWVTPPNPIALDGDPESALASLYRAFVGVRQSREPLRKGEILDHVMTSMARAGAPAQRAVYVGDFAVDVLIDGTSRAAIQVLSFCVAPTRGLAVEREAGHFLFGLERIGLEASAVVQPPRVEGARDLWASHDRVVRWLDDAGVTCHSPTEIQALAGRFGGGVQLPLSVG